MIFHALTVVLVVLKALELITWSWWLVLAPSLIVFGIWLIMIVVAVAIAGITNK